MRWLRDLSRTEGFQRAAGSLAAQYLQLVWLTNRFTVDPPNIFARLGPQLPAVISFWHGQHFPMPYLCKEALWKGQHDYSHAEMEQLLRAKVLISRHRDGEINAIAAEKLGVGTVRGSGDNGTEFHRKGGVAAFKSMLDTLAEGVSVAMTADVPKISRRAGLGTITLGKLSGRPIIPVAIATSRFIRLDNWDQSTINLPFGRGMVVAGESLTVPMDADAALMESLRQELEARLDGVHRRAYALLGRDSGIGEPAPASMNAGQGNG